ncbi:MAG: SRPBCC family protein [Betaproteobacteria bacterium]
MRSYIDVTRPDLSARPWQVTVERDMAAPPSVLYPAWTERLDQWFALRGSVLMRPLVNEPFFFETLHESTRQPHYGRFLGLEKDRLIELTWITGPSGTRGAETVVTIELESRGTGTHLRLTHAGFPDEESRDIHAEAWPLVLDVLDKAFVPEERQQGKAA